MGEIHYRDMLREELARRCQRNPKYSLRAFARDLKLSASRLSHVLKGDFGLSPAAALEIARELGWNSSEQEYFKDLVGSLHSRRPSSRAEARERVQKQSVSYRDLSSDYYQSISDWYHFAILELVQLDSFRKDAKNSTPARIAKILGISVPEATVAVDRLLRLELLEEKKGILSSTGHSTANPGGAPSAAVRNSHRQLLTKAIEALESQSVKERTISSMILAVDENRVDEAKEFIKKFRRDFDKKFSLKEENKNQVYCLGLQFFKLQENSVKQWGEKKK